MSDLPASPGRIYIGHPNGSMPVAPGVELHGWRHVGYVREPMTFLGHDLDDPMTWISPEPITMTLHLTHARGEMRRLRQLLFGRRSGPGPLCIDGHAYRRRTRRRTR